MCVYYTVRVRRVLRISRTRCYILLVMRCLSLSQERKGEYTSHAPRAVLTASAYLRDESRDLIGLSEHGPSRVSSRTHTEVL